MDFVLIASTICHFFLFWIYLWWCPMLTVSDLRQCADRMPGVYCLWLSPSVLNLVTLHSEVSLMTHRVGQGPSCCQGYCFPSGCFCLEGSGLLKHYGCCGMGDDSAPGSWQLFSQLSPQSSCPQSLLSHLQPTLLPPLPEPWVSGCKWKFVHWSFKWLFVSPAIHLWQREILLLFATVCYLCAFCGLVI